jgi:hypothetical protein
MLVFGSGARVICPGSCGVLLPVSLGWVDGRPKLRRWVKNLVEVLDSKAVDSSESLVEMLPLTV